MQRKRTIRWLSLALLLVASSSLTSCHAFLALHHLHHGGHGHHGHSHHHAPVVVARPVRRCR